MANEEPNGTSRQRQRHTAMTNGRKIEACVFSLFQIFAIFHCQITRRPKALLSFSVVSVGRGIWALFLSAGSPLVHLIFVSFFPGYRTQSSEAPFYMERFMGSLLCYGDGRASERSRAGHFSFLWVPFRWQRLKEHSACTKDKPNIRIRTQH